VKFLQKRKEELVGKGRENGRAHQRGRLPEEKKNYVGKWPSKGGRPFLHNPGERGASLFLAEGVKKKWVARLAEEGSK